MAKKTFRSVYRDKLTGKLVSKRKWKSNPKKRMGLGKRYVKQQIRIRKEPGPPPEGDVFEWVVNFSYEKSGRSFDIVTTARDETEAYNTAIEFLQGDREAQRIVRSGLRGWQPSVAKGARTNVEAGNAEYRNDTEA